jgi:PadR family transcriptional regulator PadR
LDSQSQILKGLLEGCILSIVAEKEVYGYALAEKLHEAGLTMVKEGSIYPVLLRMQKNGLIEGTMKASATGPDRKYYRLTNKGEEALQLFDATWRQLVQAIAHLRGEVR